MLTKNGKAAIAVWMTAFSSTVARFPVKSTTNVTWYAGYRNSAWPEGAYTSLITSAVTNGVVVGSGDTPVTEDDYELDSMITSGITGSVSILRTETSNSVSAKLAVTIQNSGNESVTIREIGLIQPVGVANTKGNNTSTQYPCLVERTVLDTPVVIDAGDYETIEYTITVGVGDAT